MSTRHLTVFATSGLAMALSLTAVLAGQQTAKPAAPAMTDHMNMNMKKMTKAEKIANAMTAAPASISAKASIVDYPATEGAAPEVLRKGTNGWTCVPDLPDTEGNDPACLDAPWMQWMEAYFAHKTPQLTTIGVGYMLAPGGGFASNSDPYAMKQTADNHWGHHGPHVMIAVPDQKALAGLPTDPANGGPYVMWAGTPYAHIMAPTTAPPMGGMKK